MKLLSQINVLKEKQRKGIVFREEERNMAEIISKCSSSLYKSRLIDILALERENWSYRILKSLIHDPDEKVAEKAVDTIAVFQREVDFQRMFEEAADANGFVKSWIVMITGHIGWTRDIRNEIFMERMEYLVKSSQESGYVPFYSYRWMFLVSEDETYFTKILDGIEHKNHEMRYHAMYVIDGMLDPRVLERKHLEEIRKRLYANSKCEVRYCRIYRQDLQTLKTQVVRGQELSQKDSEISERCRQIFMIGDQLYYICDQEGEKAKLYQYSENGEDEVKFEDDIPGDILQGIVTDSLQKIYVYYYSDSDNTCRLRSIDLDTGKTEEEGVLNNFDCEGLVIDGNYLYVSRDNRNVYSVLHLK